MQISNQPYPFDNGPATQATLASVKDNQTNRTSTNTSTMAVALNFTEDI